MATATNVIVSYITVIPVENGFKIDFCYSGSTPSRQFIARTCDDVANILDENTDIPRK